MMASKFILEVNARTLFESGQVDRRFHKTLEVEIETTDGFFLEILQSLKDELTTTFAPINEQDLVRVRHHPEAKVHG